MQFYWNLNNRGHIGRSEFQKKINWLPVNHHFQQFIRSMLFKLLNNTRPEYINDVSKPAPKPSTTNRVSLLKLNQPLQKTNHAKKSIS